MVKFTRSIILTAFLGAAFSASASTVQHFDFYFGDQIAGDPVQWAEIAFPQGGGCVSGPGLFGGEFDCSTTAFGADTNTADEISITGSLGSGTFNVGAWFITENGLLTAFFLDFTVAGIPVGIGGNPPDDAFGTPYPDDQNPIGIAGAWQAIFDFGDGQGPVPTGGVVLATPAPVPLPAAAWLFGSALLGLAGLARRNKA